MQILLALMVGVAVGFVLGLLGGGGSLLAVPLMVYVVGISDAHEAIGTSAVAVMLSALVGLAGHAHKRTVVWHCGMLYAAASVVGAAIGASIGRSLNSGRLLFLFAFLMILAGITILRRRSAARIPEGVARPAAPRILGYAICTGTLSGFFGIGGGFLIVPGLIKSTGMPLINAVGTSLISVAACASYTAFSYGRAGTVDWMLAVPLFGGGWAGSHAGVGVAQRASAKGKDFLEKLLACIIFTVAAGILLEQR